MEWVNFQDFLSGGYAARELAEDRKVIHLIPTIID